VFREPSQKTHLSFQSEDCSNRVDTDAWVPLEHMLGMVNKSSYKYCMKHKCECTRTNQTGPKCKNCGFTAEAGFYCKLCNYILNRDMFVKNNNLKLFTYFDYGRANIPKLYGTNLHVIDMDKTIEWLKTYQPKKKVTMVYSRFWFLDPSPGYHIIYDYKELFDSYVRTYE
jgi:hypothetical protein